MVGVTSWPVLNSSVETKQILVRQSWQMNEATPSPAINAVLTEWVEGLKRLLGKKVIGMYLSGSLAYGDFVPDRSDIDLEAVVRSPLTDDELISVEQLDKDIERGCPEWADRIECSYVPLELMQ